MFDIRAFSNFKAAASAGTADRHMLDRMKEAREATSARFVNFSIFEYRTENPDSVHFLTYPAEWLAHYARNFYAAIDPLLNTDFRRAANFDWQETFVAGSQQQMLDCLKEFGIGNEAFSVVLHAGDQLYSVTSFVYQCEPQLWQSIKTRHADDFHASAGLATQGYMQSYLERSLSNSLTARELQVLELAAMGHSDKCIANLMRIGKWTVVSHLRSAKEKLGSKNRTAAVATAITHGLINIKRLA